MPRIAKPKQPKKPSWKIPISKKDGTLLLDHGAYSTRQWNHVTRQYEQLQRDDILWREPDYQFDAILEFVNFWHGSSTHHINFRDIITNEKYTMFSSDFFDMVKAVTMHNGIVKGRFGFAKKGNSYCIQFRSKQAEETTNKEE